MNLWKNIIPYLVIALFCPLSFQIYGLTESSENIEDIYSQAVDARFEGDMARSRYLLETLMNDGLTNEYVLSLLMQVYEEYLVQLMHKKDLKTLQIAYPGIRENIAKIWDMYPKSPIIQNSGLKIAWMVNDSAMGVAMSELILNYDPDSLLANYFSGVYRLTLNEYAEAVPYFQKAANSVLESGNEEYIFRSRMLLGDIAFEQRNKIQALKHYRYAAEVAFSPELGAKIAMLETYNLEFSSALKAFQQVPIEIMSPQLFDAYLASLFAEHSEQSIECMNYLLSQSKNNSPFAQSLIYYQLGRTQKSLEMLDKDQFVLKELPWSHYYLKSLLMKRFQCSNELLTLDFQMGKFAFEIGKFDKAWNYLYPIRNKGIERDEKAFLLAKIASSEKQYDQAQKFYLLALKSPKFKNNFRIYADLIELNINNKKFSKAREYLIKASQLPDVDFSWLNLMEGYFYFANKEYLQAQKYILKVLSTEASNNILINNFLADIYFAQKNYRKAEVQLKKTYKLDPINPDTLNHLAYLYALLKKNLDQALEFSTRAVSFKPEDIAYLDTLAWVYVQRDELDMAEPIFEEIEFLLDQEKNVDEFAEIFAHLAIYYKKIGDSVKSQLYFQKVKAFTFENDYIKILESQR